MLVVQSPSVTPKAPTVPSEASSSVATNASITVSIRHTGELVSIIKAIAVGAGKLSVGVDVREAVSLRNAHNTQTPELVCKRNRDHREEVSGGFCFKMTLSKIFLISTSQVVPRKILFVETVDVDHCSNSDSQAA